MDQHQWEQLFGKWGFALYMGFKGLQNKKVALPDEMDKSEAL
jgi:hypothetical protein